MENPLTPQSSKTQADQSSSRQSQEDFSEPKALLDEEFSLRAERDRQRDEASRARLHLQEGFGELHASYRWFSWKRLLIYVPGTILFVFLGILFSWLDLTFSSRSGVSILTITEAGLLIVGLWGIYRITAVLINRTVIVIASDRLSVHHGPLPYPGNCSVQCDELKEVRVEKRSREGLPLFLPVEGSPGLTPKADFYELRTVLKDGRKFKLVYGSDEQTIHYLEATITQHLRLQDSSPTNILEVIPAGLEVQQEFDSHKVTYRSFSWIRMLGCLLIAISGLGLGTMLLTSTGMNAADDQIAVFVALLMGLSGIYLSLVTALNRTVIDISSKQICVHHGPLPTYPGTRSVACVDLQQLSAEECEHESNQEATYQLRATLKTGENLTLWSNASRERIDYVKQAIERRMGRFTTNAASV